MRNLVRTLSAIALVVATALIPAAAASAKQSPAKWAKQHHLKGTWRTKDADKDGLKNLAEFKLGTDPRKADSDRDGLRDGDEVKAGDDPTDPDTDGDKVKDGAEHAGVVTAFDGDTVTIRQFKGGTLTATVSEDTDCSTADDSSGDDSAGDDSAGDSSADDSSSGDDTTGDPGADAATVDDDETDVDVGADDSSAGDTTVTCDDAGLAKGAVVRSAEVERDGGELVLTALELTP